MGILAFLLAIPHSNATLKTYDNSTLGFSIQYPAVDSKITENGDIVAFTLPSVSSYLLIEVTSLPSANMSLEQYTNVTIDALNQSHTSFNIFDRTTVATLSNNPANKILYSDVRGENENEFKTMQLWTIKDEKVYDIAYIANSTTYEKDRPIAEQMINSFKITEKETKSLDSVKDLNMSTDTSTTSSSISTNTSTSSSSINNKNNKPPEGQNDLDNKAAVTGKSLVGIEENPFVRNTKIIKFSGKNYADVADSRDFNVNGFTISTWFNTAMNAREETYLVNKGNLNTGNDRTENNLNYGLFLTKDEQVSGGFETSTGDVHIITSPESYNDEKWHQAVLTFDQISRNLKLYMDGSEVATDTINAGVIPDNSGNSPVRLGASSLSEEGNTIGGFKGQLDDMTIWNVAATDNQILDLYNKESKISR